MKITVNGTAHEVEAAVLTYEEVVRLAGERVGASVTYSGPRHGDSRREGIMCRGETVKIEDEMRFNACMTGNA